MDEIQFQGNVDQALSMMEAQKVALQSQVQKTGIRWVDAANFAVRPLTTYYFLLFYGLVKLATLIVAMRASDPWIAILQVWTENDASILAGILAFWFVGRVFDKQK